MPDARYAAATAALVRTLRDIDDGHINLWIEALYDPNTGKPLPTASLTIVSDRAPAIGTPTPADGRWWNELLTAGLLQPSPPGTPRPRLQLSAAGRQALERQGPNR